MDEGHKICVFGAMFSINSLCTVEKIAASCLTSDFCYTGQDKVTRGCTFRWQQILNGVSSASENSVGIWEPGNLISLACIIFSILATELQISRAGAMATQFLFGCTFETIYLAMLFVTDFRG